MDIDPSQTCSKCHAPIGSDAVFLKNGSYMCPACFQRAYPGLHYEAVAVSLGGLLRSQKDYYGAAVAYELVSQVAKPDPEISQKANLEAGEVYDLLQKRDQALNHYQAVIATDGGTSFSQTARKRMKDPYRGD